MDQAKEEEIQEQLEPLDQDKSGMAGRARTSSNSKEAWATIVTKKKSSSITQSMATRSWVRNST